MKRYVELGDIADINVGVVLSRKEATYRKSTSISYDLFNLKIYEDKMTGSNSQYEKFTTDESLDDYVIKENDLLMRLAFPLKIIYADKDLSGKLISNQYVRVRLKNDDFRAKFVRWYLESEDVYHQLEKYLVGTAVRTIPVVKIKEIRIPIVNKRKQINIEKLVDIWNEQKILFNNLVDNKEKLINESIKLIIKEEN